MFEIDNQSYGRLFTVVEVIYCLLVQIHPMFQSILQLKLQFNKPIIID